MSAGGPSGVVLRVLGPFEVEADGRALDVGGPRLRAMLAMLAAGAGRVVSVAAFVRELWGDSPPPDAERTVRTYVSRLRRSLTPDLILTRPPGYLLALDPDALDAARFERLAATGRQALEAGRPEVASELLVEALRLWRGSAYDEFTSSEILDAEGSRLENLRRTAVQDRIDADLAIGNDRGLITELEGLVSAYPGHERLWGQLMTALYRAGRQADALETFRRARRLLVTDSGVEPSPVLTTIHRRILTQDPHLLAPRGGRAAETAHLSHDSASATGTADEIESLLSAGTRALTDDGDLQTSRRRFETAYRLAEQTGDTDAQARAVLGLGGIWVHEYRTSTGETRLQTRLRDALSAVGPDSPLALRVRIRLAGETDYKAAEHTAIFAALAEARQAGDPVAVAEALSLAHHCVLGPDYGALRQRLARELIGESSRTGRRVDLIMGLLWHTVDLFLAADPHAERRLDELKELIAAPDHLAAGFVASAIQVMLTIRSGRFDKAEEQAQACAELGQQAGDFDALAWHGGQLVAIRWFQGRLAELLPFLDELVHSATLSSIDNSIFAALAIAAVAAGDRRKAAGALARLCGSDLADLPRSSTWLVSMCGVVETAYFLGDAETAATAYRLLTPFAHLPMAASLAVTCFGSTHYALGVAAMTGGDVELAVTHFATAVRNNLAIGHWPAVVLTRRRHAQALTLRARPEDAELARRELAAADEEALSLGIHLGS